MKIHLGKVFLLFSFYVLIISCRQQSNDYFPEPEIKSGIARVSGKLINSGENFEEQPELDLYYQNPFSSGRKTFTTNVQQDGTFLFEIPVECSSLAMLSSTLFYKEEDIAIGFGLIPGEETKIEMGFNEGQITQLNIESSIAFTLNDVKEYSNTYYKISGHIPTTNPNPEYKTFEEYVQLVLNSLERRVEIAQNEPDLSNPVKNFLTNQIRLMVLNDRLFQYKDYMELDYRNKYPEKDRNSFELTIKPGIADYSYLSYFNLNDPLYLYNFEYNYLMQSILWDETLNIPRIGEEPVAGWLKEVKSIMANLLGFDKGLFYDMLVMNAYIRQFDNELKPLSEIQKTNIQTYFKNNEIANVLIEQNNKISQLDKEKNYFPLVVNETSEIPPSQIKKTILAKYKGKNIMMDFWATWCPPCLDGIQDFQQIKPLIKEENIVLVYIADHSSPQEFWQEKINSIGGEHYYLSNEQSIYLSNEFELQARPTYLFFDTQGQLQRKVVGRQENDVMKNYINELLGK